MSDDEREEKELDLTSPEVVTKYKGAAEIVNKALQLVVAECKPKTKIVDLCEKGDTFIKEQTGNMYKNVKKKIERGVAFPTCISVNNTVCHFSPLSSDETVLEEGDMVKIDMGCHIDGFIAVVAHTHVAQGGPVTGRAADVLAAANTAAEVALRLVRPGRKNSDVTEAIQKVAAAYDCKIVEGVLSHQMKQFVIDGNKVVLSVFNPDTRVDDAEFEENEVYSIDIVTSTGEGKPKLLDEKQTTIYKRAVDKSYNLKMKASRFIFSEISQKFPIMPFTARDLEEKRARLGLVECVNHDLLQPYPVLHEKPGDLVAHIKFTVLLMPNGSDRITSHALQELTPAKTIDDEPEIKTWLALPVKTKKKGGGKKKKGKKGEKPTRSLLKRRETPLDAPFHLSFSRNYVKCWGISLCFRKPKKYKVFNCNVKVEDEACELVNGVELSIGDGVDSIDAYLCNAVKNNNGTGILLLSDVFGFEDTFTRDFAYRVACNGYNVLVPDMFRGNPWRKDEPQALFEQWIGSVDKQQVVRDIFTSAKWMANEFVAAGISKTFGVIGFCFGGGLLIDILAQDQGCEFGVGISFYGTRIDLSVASKIEVPLLLIAGDNDPLCPVNVLKEVENNVNGCKMVVFEGRGHDFAHRAQSLEDDKDAEEAFLMMRNWLHDGLLSEN